MAQSASNSNSTTRKSLRLLTAERKSTSNESFREEIDQQETSPSQTRRAKAKAIEALNTSQQKRRIQSDADLSDETEDSLIQSRTQKRRNHPKRKPKRQRNSSSDDDDSLSKNRSTNRRQKEKTLDSEPQQEAFETGNNCIRRGSASRNPQAAAPSDPSTSAQRRSARYSYKSQLDYSTPVQESTCRGSITQPSASDNRSCNSNPGAIPSSSDPLNLFVPPIFYPSGLSSSPASSSAQSVSGSVPVSSFSYSLTNSHQRHPKISLAMSTESDTDPESSINAHDLITDPSFLRAAAASGASSASAALLQTLSGRVHHLMNRVGGSSSINGRLQQYIQGMQSPDPDVKLTTLNELCSLLVMSNEDTLPAYQCRALYAPLRDCLADENEANSEIVLTACRALTYLMEALPRTAMQVVEATPIFLSKLRMITSIDIAEQTLIALEMISKRNAKQILVADGIGACLAFIEFFSINSQNKALAIVANCCAHITTKDEFQYIREHLETLASRLQSDDKKTIEYVCTIFARLVENLSRSSTILCEILSTDLLKTLQTMIVIQPSLLNSITFTSIIHMLYIASASCPKLAVTLLKMNIGESLICLLTGSAETKAQTRKSIAYKSATVLSGNDSTIISSIPHTDPIELLSRTPQELYEIVSLIGEILPKLPNDEPLFQVDQYLRSGQTEGIHVSVLWHWQDDQGQLRPYSIEDSQRIEAAWEQHEEEVQLNISGRRYILDLQQLQQINEETSQTRFIKRITNPFSNEPSSPSPTLSSRPNDSTSTTNDNTPSTTEKPIDARIQVLNDDFQLYNNFIQSLFTILYEVYNSSAGPAVKHRCLQSLLRMIYYSPASLLEDILRQQSISSHIASMLASSDYKIVISALQISEILMKKLPKIFSVYFYREGVVHQIEILIGFGVSSSLQISMGRTQTTGQIENPVSFDIESGQSSTSNVTETNRKSETPSASNLRGNGSQLHAKTHSFPYRMNSSRRQTETSATDLSTSRVETRSQRGRTGTGSTHSRMKTSGRSTLDEMMVTGNEHSSSSVSRGRAQRATGSTPLRATTMDPSVLFSPFGNTSRGRGISPMYIPPPFSSQAIPPFMFPSSAPASGSLFLSSNPMMTHSNLTLSSQEKNKLKDWIQNQARHFRSTYFADNSPNSNIALETIRRLASAVEQLHVTKSHEENHQALSDIAQILNRGDVSPFEMVHSGLITKLYQYLTDDISNSQNRIDRLKLFLHVFINLPNENEDQHLKDFLLRLHQRRLQQEKPTSNNILSQLINKLHGCINQLEQFPIRVNDTAGRTTHHSTLRIMSSHQLKCNLVRHPQCKTLKQWNSGPVKVDPLAMVSALEKYLLLRGVAMDDPSGTIEDEDSEVSNESDAEDIINVLAHGPSMRLEFLINDHLIPNSMPLIEAVRMFSQASANRTTDGESETDNDESSIPSTSIWIRIHTIHYRQMNTSSAAVAAINSAIGGASNTASSSRSYHSSASAVKSSATTKKSIRTSKRSTTTAPTIDELWIDGQCPQKKSLLKLSLNESISKSLTINDLSLNALCLLHILNALNLYWSDLYAANKIIFSHSISSLSFLTKNEFISSKLTSKVNRQLQDQIVLMMGQVPSWISEIGYKCLFLFPFETRQMIFYTHAFDRERAIQRLIDASSLGSHQQVHHQPHHDLMDRHGNGPRVERKKVQLSRGNILPEMEKILDSWNSKQFLEVQYEDEVGFGLGPTLEAYSLISRELQKTGLEIWRTDVSIEHIKEKDASLPEYVDNQHGLFPAPFGRNAKSTLINKVRQKFKFLGKFMAKALMDSRMIDMPFNIVFYKWMLSNEDSLSFEDLSSIDPNLYEQLKKLQNIVYVRDKIIEENHKVGRQRRRSRSKDDGSSMDTTPMLNENDPSLLLDGCKIDDLALVFTLPGHPNIELKKGGKDCSVTLQNLDQYIQLVVHWILVEGVRRQFESFRDGFNSIFPVNHLKCFYPDELHQVFCGSGSTEFWDLKVLLESTRCDHGYNLNSRAVKWLFELMVDFDVDEQRAFLQFVTGSPRLPVGGFRMLHPPLTIVRKTAENNSDNINPDSFLPSVMTCVNYLKLPDYSSKEMMKLKLTTAIRDGQYAFLLS